MIDQSMANRLHGCQVIDRAGEKIGSVDQVWLDDRTGQPVWATVQTGLLGMKESFVPVQTAELHDDGEMHVPVSKDQVKEAPRIEAADGHISADEQRELYRHYHIPSPGSPGDDLATGQTGQTGQRAGAGDTTTAPGTTGFAGEKTGQRTAGDDAMTRSEERLNVGVEKEEVGRVRLVKHVVTENQQINVPVSHEEVRLEREPITDVNKGEALEGPEIAEGEYEVRLHAEKPVVTKETVPVERVRLTTETVTDQETVSGEVRKEQIEVEDDSGQLSQRPDTPRGKPQPPR